MKLSLGGVSVQADGFHPIILFRLWRVGRKMWKDDKFENEVITAFANSGMRVTRTVRDENGEVTEMRRWNLECEETNGS